MIHSQAILRLPNAISHNVYYVKHRQVLLRPDPPPAGIALAGFASRRKAEAGQRKAGQRQMVKVVVVDLGEFRDRHFGRSAG